MKRGDSIQMRMASALVMIVMMMILVWGQNRLGMWTKMKMGMDMAIPMVRPTNALHPKDM
jgi:hypothetical protein